MQMSRGSKKYTSSVNLKIVRQGVCMLCIAAMLHPSLLLKLFEDFKGSQVITCFSHHSHHRLWGNILPTL